jgi:SAM-dependent methyltransferase
VGSDDIRARLTEEASAAESTRGRWYAEYIGHSYRSATELALSRAGDGSVTILKTDLWNECLGGTRDIGGWVQQPAGGRFVGVDIALEVCTLAHARVPQIRVVQADIRALPFRQGAFDALLDLSTLDHLPDTGIVQAINEYRRVLRAQGALVVVFWQLNALMKQRLLLKRLIGRQESGDQHYFARAAVRASCRRGFVIFREFVAGALLMPPHRLTGFLLSRLPAAFLVRLLRCQVRLECSPVLRPLLQHFAGLYGIAAIRASQTPVWEVDDSEGRDGAGWQRRRAKRPEV